MAFTFNGTFADASGGILDLVERSYVGIQGTGFDLSSTSFDIVFVPYSGSLSKLVLARIASGGSIAMGSFYGTAPRALRETFLVFEVPSEMPNWGSGPVSGTIRICTPYTYTKIAGSPEPSTTYYRASAVGTRTPGTPSLTGIVSAGGGTFNGTINWVGAQNAYAHEIYKIHPPNMTPMLVATKNIVASPSPLRPETYARYSTAGHSATIYGFSEWDQFYVHPLYRPSVIPAQSGATPAHTSSATYTYSTGIVPPPISLHATNIDYTTADLAWTAPQGGPTGGYIQTYDIYNKIDGIDTLIQANFAANTPDSVYPVTMLERGKEYTFGVRSSIPGATSSIVYVTFNAKATLFNFTPKLITNTKTVHQFPAADEQLTLNGTATTLAGITNWNIYSGTLTSTQLPTNDGLTFISNHVTSMASPELRHILLENLPPNISNNYVVSGLDAEGNEIAFGQISETLSDSSLVVPFPTTIGEYTTVTTVNLNWTAEYDARMQAHFGRISSTGSSYMIDIPYNVSQQNNMCAKVTLSKDYGIYEVAAGYSVTFHDSDGTCIAGPFFLNNAQIGETYYASGHATCYISGLKSNAITNVKFVTYLSQTAGMGGGTGEYYRQSHSAYYLPVWIPSAITGPSLIDSDIANKPFDKFTVINTTDYSTADVVPEVALWMDYQRDITQPYLDTDFGEHYTSPSEARDYYPPANQDFSVLLGPPPVVVNYDITISNPSDPGWPIYGPNLNDPVRPGRDKFWNIYGIAVAAQNTPGPGLSGTNKSSEAEYNSLLPVGIELGYSYSGSYTPNYQDAIDPQTLIDIAATPFVRHFSPISQFTPLLFYPTPIAPATHIEPVYNYVVPPEIMWVWSDGLYLAWRCYNEILMTNMDNVPAFHVKVTDGRALTETILLEGEGQELRLGLSENKEYMFLYRKRDTVPPEDPTIFDNLLVVPGQHLRFEISAINDTFQRLVSDNFVITAPTIPLPIKAITHETLGNTSAMLHLDYSYLTTESQYDDFEFTFTNFDNPADVTVFTSSQLDAQIDNLAVGVTYTVTAVARSTYNGITASSSPITTTISAAYLPPPEEVNIVSFWDIVLDSCKMDIVALGVYQLDAQFVVGLKVDVVKDGIATNVVTIPRAGLSGTMYVEIPLTPGEPNTLSTYYYTSYGPGAKREYIVYPVTELPLEEDLVTGASGEDSTYVVFPELPLVSYVGYSLFDDAFGINQIASGTQYPQWTPEEGDIEKITVNCSGMRKGYVHSALFIYVGKKVARADEFEDSVVINSVPPLIASNYLVHLQGHPPTPTGLQWITNTTDSIGITWDGTGYPDKVSHKLKIVHAVPDDSHSNTPGWTTTETLEILGPNAAAFNAIDLTSGDDYDFELTLVQTTLRGEETSAKAILPRMRTKCVTPTNLRVVSRVNRTSLLIACDEVYGAQNYELRVMGRAGSYYSNTNEVLIQFFEADPSWPMQFEVYMQADNYTISSDWSATLGVEYPTEPIINNIDSYHAGTGHFIRIVGSGFKDITIT